MSKRQESLRLIPYETLAEDKNSLFVAAEGLACIIKNERSRKTPRILKDFTALPSRYNSIESSASRIEQLAGKSGSRYFTIVSGLTVLGVASIEQIQTPLDSPTDGCNVSFWTEAPEQRPKNQQRRIGSEIVNLIMPNAENFADLNSLRPIWTAIRPENSSSKRSFDESVYTLNNIGKYTSSCNKMSYNAYEITKKS